MVRSHWIVLLGIAAIGLYALLGALNLYWGDLNQDEGWYLYAAGQVRQGSLPYRDFAFTQGPVFPFVYSLATPLVEKWGVAGGRLFTGGLGLAGALLAAWLAARISQRGLGRMAALLAFIFIAGTVYQSYFTVVVKTYSLCAVFLTAGAVALSYANTRVGGASCFFGGVLMALAAGTRLSAGVALPIAGAFLLLRRKRLGDLCWIVFGVGGLVTLAAISLPFLVVAREAFVFNVFEYHSGRSAGGLFPLLAYKAGFVSRLAQAYFVPVAIGLTLIVLRLVWRPAGDDATTKSHDGYSTTLWLIVLAVTLVHLAAPFPYEDYQVIAFPLFAAALAAATVRAVDLFQQVHSPWNRLQPWMLWLLISVFLVSSMASFSSPINQSWFVQGRDRIWWRLREESALQRLRKTARWLKEQAPDAETILTQDTYLAVEMGVSVPHGLELGPFSYYPDMPRERAERLNLLNREMMLELIEHARAPVAAISGYGFAVSSPEVTEVPSEEQDVMWNSLLQRYEEVRRIHGFGQADTTLRILKRASSEEGSASQ